MNNHDNLILDLSSNLGYQFVYQTILQPCLGKANVIPYPIALHHRRMEVRKFFEKRSFMLAKF